MRKIDLSVLTTIAGVVLATTPALAEDLGSGFTVNGGATLVSDYRFRGISQTDRQPAIQATFTVGHESGFYANLWGSSIDDYVAAGSDQEIDLVFGYSKTFDSGTRIDVGVLYYYYPGSGGANTDFVEPYASVSHTLGPITGKLSAAYAPAQSALTIGAGDEDNLYVAGDLSAAIPNTPIGVTGHIGHSFGPSYLTIGEEYTDWSLSVSATFKVLTVGVAYVDTDKDAFNAANGRNISKGGIVASVGVAF